MTLVTNKEMDDSSSNQATSPNRRRPIDIPNEKAGSYIFQPIEWMKASTGRIEPRKKWTDASQLGLAGSYPSYLNQKLMIDTADRLGESTFYLIWELFLSYWSG